MYTVKYIRALSRYRVIARESALFILLKTVWNEGETNMATMRTIPKAVEEIKAKDPKTALTVLGLRRLVRTGELRVTKVGKRAFVSMETLEAFLQGEGGACENR